MTTWTAIPLELKLLVIHSYVDLILAELESEPPDSTQLNEFNELY